MVVRGYAYSASEYMEPANHVSPHCCQSRSNVPTFDFIRSSFSLISSSLLKLAKKQSGNTSVKRRGHDLRLTISAFTLPYGMSTSSQITSY